MLMVASWSSRISRGERFGLRWEERGGEGERGRGEEGGERGNDMGTTLSTHVHVYQSNFGSLVNKHLTK